MDIDTSVLLKNKALLLLSVLLVFLVCGGGWFLYERVMLSVEALDTIPTKEDELKLLTDRVLKLDGVDEDIYRQRNVDLIEVLPENIDLSLALGGLVTIVRDNKFEVIAGKTNNSQTEGQKVIQNIILKFTGNNSEVRPMLDRLSKIKPILKPVSLEAIFQNFDSAEYTITVETYGWSYPQTTIDPLTVSLPAIDNQNKYEKLFSDIKSWEKIVPALDFVFEGSDQRDIFKFGRESDIVNNNLEPTPSPTPTIEIPVTLPDENEI